MRHRRVDVVVGMAAGSEAKGKLIEQIAHKYDYLVRTGSVNAAHTVYYKGEKIAWHQLPAGSLHAGADSKLILGAGAQIDETYLKRELEILADHGMLEDRKGDPRLIVDPNATIIDEHDKWAENGFADVCGPQWYDPTSCRYHNGDRGPDGEPKPKGGCEGCSLYPEHSMHRSIGSTTHGSGMNLCRKIARGTALIRDDKGQPMPPVRQARDVDWLRPYLADTVAILGRAGADPTLDVLVEGTQGSTLSLHHGHYPFTTSRDTTAAAWLSEAGISPLAVRDIFGVVQTFPIRVAGNSGPMGSRELTWQEVSERAGVPYVHDDDPAKVKGLIQYTTATKRVRRIFEFDHDGFRKAMMMNRPTQLMLSFVDYLSAEDYGKSRWEDLSDDTQAFIRTLEETHNVHFRWLSTGPLSHHIIDRGES